MSLPNSNSYDAVGGEIADYQPVEDPTTDRSADAEDEVFADTCAMTRTAVRAYCTFTTNGTTCVVLEHDAVWGNSLPVKPTVTRAGAGSYTVTWPATVTDARGISRALNLRRGTGNIELGGWAAAVIPLSPNSVSIVTASMAAGAVAESTATPITASVW